MKLSPTLRRSLVLVAGGVHYLAIVSLLGLDMRPSTLAQYTGHAMIYGSGVAVYTILFFVLERAAQKRKEEEMVSEAHKLSSVR